MRVIPFDDWHSFNVVIPRGNETDQAYLLRLMDYLQAFHDQYTSLDYHDTLFQPDRAEAQRNWRLENFAAWGGNFMDMHLKPSCDVKYQVRLTGDERLPPGIHVRSHPGKEKDEQRNYLKRCWEEFEFKE
jgi:hypothetical protein